MLLLRTRTECCVQLFSLHTKCCWRAQQWGFTFSTTNGSSHADTWISIIPYVAYLCGNFNKETCRELRGCFDVFLRWWEVSQTVGRNGNHEAVRLEMRETPAAPLNTSTVWAWKSISVGPVRCHHEQKMRWQTHLSSIKGQQEFRCSSRENTATEQQTESE